MSADSPAWSCDPCSIAAVDRLSRQLGVSAAVAQILVRRGLGNADDARLFLAAGERHDPSLFAGIDAACELILAHVERGSRIVVHGDYDVDGICSTAIVVRALRALGGHADWHLPSRFDDGYGLSARTVARLAAEGAGLLVTVDCGITATVEVEQARGLGLDVVVTDHHLPGPVLPDCPVVHPTVCGYPCADLCAAGVAYKLAEALYSRAGEDPARAEEDLDLVALATVADCVPLRGENRRLVRDGLGALKRTRKVGLRSLMRIASLDPGAVDEQSAAFRLSPRLNAAGRLGRADAALELVLTGDESRAAEVADELDLLNRERRDAETRILFAAEAARAEHPEGAAHVLAGEGWHPGVIGIVASRLVERYHRPCLLIALGPDGGRGSGRSIAAYDLHAGLAACAAHLTRFGGHAMAAGFELGAAEVERFRAALTDHAASVLSPEDLRPVERIDAVVSGDAVGFGLAEDLARLAPFGEGNPAPTLLVPAARIGDVRSMGQERQHASFTITSGGARARVVAFRTGRQALASAAERPQDVAARLELNEWAGTVEPRLVLRALCPTEEGRIALCEEGEEPFATAFARELHRGPGQPGPAPLGGGARLIRDRRAQGIAGVAGELLAAGEEVLVVCADAARRREGLESVIGGLARAGDGPRAVPGLVSWQALRDRPDVARAYAHLLAVDPPTVAGGEELLVHAPAGDDAAFAHLAWGAAEVSFALAVLGARLDPREELVALYRSLRDRGGPVSGAQLETLLRGPREHGRTAAQAARLARMLVELELVSFEEEPADGLRCIASTPEARTPLRLSPSYREHVEQASEATRGLEKEARRLPGDGGRRAEAAEPA